MDENQNTNEEHTVLSDGEKTCAGHGNCGEYRMHPLLKLLLLGIITFLGTFCAAYVIIDWHAKNLLGPFYGNMPMFEKAIRQDMKMMDRTLRSDKMFQSPKVGNIIHLERDGNFYEIKIDMRPFDNNADNLNITTENKVLTITGRAVKKNKNKEEISRFQQSYMFGDNVKLNELEKTVKGHYFVVTIPIAPDEED